MQRRAPVPAGLELVHDLRELAVRARRIDDLRQSPPVGRHLRHALAHRGRPRLGLGRRRAGGRGRLRRTSHVKLCPGGALPAKDMPKYYNTAVAAYRHMQASKSGLGRRRAGDCSRLRRTSHVKLCPGGALPAKDKPGATIRLWQCTGKCWPLRAGIGPGLVAKHARVRGAGRLRRAQGAQVR